MEVAALGRPFRLGMLYDCRIDQLIPGKGSPFAMLLDCCQDLPVLGKGLSFTRIQ